jgi:hypothetical protein
MRTLILVIIRLAFAFYSRPESYFSAAFRYIGRLFDSTNSDLRRGMPLMWWSFLPFTSDLQQTTIVSCKLLILDAWSPSRPLCYYDYCVVLQFTKSIWDGWKKECFRTVTAMQCRTRESYRPVAHCIVRPTVIFYVLIYLRFNHISTRHAWRTLNSEYDTFFRHTSTIGHGVWWHYP